MMRTICLLFVLVMLVHAPAAAQQQQRQQKPLGFLLAGALELGGDEVAKVYFTNGDDQSVKAGQGGTIAMGLQYTFPKLKQLLLRGTIGIKYVTTAADNAHIRLTRVPLQFTANWMAAPKFRIGAGMVSHTGVRFKADGIGEDIRLNGGSGPVFEIAYGVVGLSYTTMAYTDQYKNKYAANAIGITVSGVLPGRKAK